MQKLSSEQTFPISHSQFSPFYGPNDSPVKYDGIPQKLGSEDISFLHYHNEVEIGYCMEGTGMCVIGEKIFTFSAGDFTIVAPKVPHYHKTLSETDCICNFIFFDLEKIFSFFKLDTPEKKLLFYTDVFSKVIRSNDADELLIPLKDLLRLATGYDSSKSPAELLLCFFLLSERLKKYGAPFQLSKPNPMEQKLTPAINLIATEYGSDLSIEELANACYMSKSHFMREFNNVYGISAYAFLNRFRVYAAREMLIHTNYSIAYIGEACGFNSFSNFFRQFKKYFHSSPTECRDENNTNKASTTDKKQAYSET